MAHSRSDPRRLCAHLLRGARRWLPQPLQCRGIECTRDALPSVPRGGAATVPFDRGDDRGRPGLSDLRVEALRTPKWNTPLKSSLRCVIEYIQLET